MSKTRLTILTTLLILSAKMYSQTITELESRIQEAELTHDTTAIAKAWYNLGKFYDNDNEPVKSNSALKTALFWAESNKNHSAVSSIANYLASNYSIQSRSDSAIFYYNVAIDKCIAGSDSLKLASILINLGDEYATRGNYTEAVNHSLMAVSIKETIKDSVNLAYFYQKVGEVYKIAGENGKWEEYIQKAYQLIHYEKCAGIMAIAAIYNDLGGIAEHQGNYPQALLYYDTLISFGKENNYNNAIGVALSNSATIYKLQGDIETALTTAVEAQKFRNNTVYQQITDNNLLAELSLANNKTQDARKYAGLSFENEHIGHFPEEKMRCLKILYQIEKKDNNFQKALYWNELHKQVSDSIRDKEIRTRIVDMEIAYQTEKKEQQIELLTTENQMKNQRIRAGFFLLAVLLIVIFMILYILHIRRKQARLVQNDLQQQVLRSQMNPHFIFNVLGSIQNFLLGNDNKKAATYLSQFASLTRATLEYSASQSISLTNEINMLKNYMELEKMRNPAKFSFSIITGEDLETDLIQIPPMMIQPFIENSVKHGFADINYPGILTLSISDKNEWIRFIIEDNGKGLIHENAAAKHRSMAMDIFEKRRKLIQQKHKKELTFEMQNLKEMDASKSGVRIIIQVPVLDYD